MDQSGHIHDGGTAVTNFNIEQIVIYAQAIEEYNDMNLFIGEAMPPCVGWKNMRALRLRNSDPYFDLSNFWDIFNRIEKAAKTVK